MEIPSLETIRVRVPEAAAGAYRAALETDCLSLAWFDAPRGMVEIEAVRESRPSETLTRALLLAAAATGVAATIERTPTQESGWLESVRESVPERPVGRRFLIRPSHIHSPRPSSRIMLVLDAGLAFGSGEHASTRGVLLALEGLAPHRPRSILDLGTGSGILSLAAARLWHQSILAADCDPIAIRTARANAAKNSLAPLVRFCLSDGWRNPTLRKRRYDLVLANIFARPLCRMARPLARHLSPGGRAILAGFLRSQVPMVLAAHRRRGLVLERAVRVTDDANGWVVLVLRRPQPSPKDKSLLASMRPRALSLV